LSAIGTVQAINTMMSDTVATLKLDLGLSIKLYAVQASQIPRTRDGSLITTAGPVNSDSDMPIAPAINYSFLAFVGMGCNHPILLKMISSCASMRSASAIRGVPSLYMIGAVARSGNTLCNPSSHPAKMAAGTVMLKS